MSISLGIRWADGTDENVGIATQSNAKRWAVLAGGLQLELLSGIDLLTHITPANVPKLQNELQILRNAVIGQHEDIVDIEAVDRLVRALGRLEATSGWTADIG